MKQKIQVEAYELNEALQLVREEIELKREQHIIQVIFTCKITMNNLSCIIIAIY